MARQPRIHLPGGLYHVTMRGNNKQIIFFAQEDRAYFLELLGEGINRFGHRIHAFCLMTNHVHLAIQVADVELSKIIQNVAFRYARFINQRYQRVGHLFQGRYHATMVGADRYFLELVRYIHLNPVRANLVSHPIAYEWSSHVFYLGQAHLPWLTTNMALREFGTRRTRAIERFSQFIVDRIDDQADVPNDSPFSASVSSDSLFYRQATRNVARRWLCSPKLEEIVSVVCTAYGIDSVALQHPGKHRLASEARAVVAYFAFEFGAGDGSRVAATVVRTRDNVYRSVAQMRSRIATDRHLRRRIAALRHQIHQSSGLTPGKANTPIIRPDPT